MRKFRGLLFLLFLHPTLWAATAAKSQFFTTSDGIKLHYLESGTGATILFIPGWTMPAWIWQPQLDYFSRSYHVVAIDPRSQGESDKTSDGNYPGRRARDYKELIDHLGGTPVVMVGWSLAVSESLTFVNQFGTSQLKGLVLVDLDLYTPASTEANQARYTQFHTFQAQRRRYTDTFVRGMYKKPQSEDYLKSVIEASLKTPTDTGIALIGELATKNDQRDVLPKLNIPVLAVMTAANRAAAEMITSKVSGGQAEVFEDAGHCLFVDDADRFNTLLDTFVKKAEAR